MLCATLCYMDRVGVRELRQNLSVYLRRIARGDSLEVTDRGRAVALLAPLPDGRPAREALIGSGRLLPASGTLVDLGVPPPSTVSQSISDALAEERAEHSA